MEATLFLVESRSVELLCASLKEMLGGDWEEDKESKMRGVPRYSTYVFGLICSLRYEESWLEGSVYRFTVSNAPGYYFLGVETRDVSFHVLPLLVATGVGKVLLFDEFVSESQRRGMR